MDLAWPITAIFLLVTLSWAVFRFERGTPMAVSDWAFTLAGGMYLGWLGMHFVLLRNMTGGLYWTSFALSCAWLVDTGAYAVGRPWGKHKMSPNLSPSKTWEGYFGGILGAIICSGAWILIAGSLNVGLPPGFNFWNALLAGLLVAILTPLGDLGESMLKRWGKVKDSGNLIPGHGGMLDRLDTLLWAAVIVYYYVKWVI
jgi:phosphatidate cytidylyltransferase